MIIDVKLAIFELSAEPNKSPEDDDPALSSPHLTRTKPVAGCRPKAEVYLQSYQQA
jgi:hypothetical protein